MFSTKQSDIFYNDETKEMFVCKVSAISAERCEGGDEVVYGALPLIYKINKADNYKTLVYPKNLNTIQTDPNSDLYNLTPTCPTSGTNFDSITKPLINYNTSTSRYSVTFLGRYSNDNDGLGLNNYIFQDINPDFYLLDANAYIPKDKDVPDVQPFTFANGYLNSDLYVVGNTIRNDKPSWFAPNDDLDRERSTDYQVAPMHVQATSSLGFNLLLGNTDVTVDNLSGNVAFPFMYSGGFITYNPKYTAYDPEYTIRVDFTARCFNNVSSPTDPVTAYGSSQTVSNSATRWIQQYAPPGPGEGFCVSFFKNPPKNSYVIPNGVGSTLGYAKAGFSPNEVAGTAQRTDGLWLHNNWNPNTGMSATPGANVDSSYGPAESFLGVGFDIGGNFASTTEEKQGWTNGTSYTATPCSIGIRASSYYDTKVLTAFAMNTVAASAVPMHTSAADAEFVDYRIDLSNKGTKVTLYNKLTSATDYNTIVEYRLNRGNCGTGVGIGSSHSYTYQPWYNMQSSYQQATDTLPPLNVGLSFTTSDNASRFELYKFEVTGVVIKNPWEEKIEEQVEEITASVTKKIDYLQESSKNLRKKLLNVESDDLVDVDMVIPAKNIIANTINEETNKPQITLCDGSNPEIIEQDVTVNITGINPDQVDDIVTVGELGYTPKEFGVKTIVTGSGTEGDDTTSTGSNDNSYEPEPDVGECNLPVTWTAPLVKFAWPSTTGRISPDNFDINSYEQGTATHLQPVTQTGGSVQELVFSLTSGTGVVQFEFQPFDVPVRAQVFWPGPAEYANDGKPTNLVIDTGFIGKAYYRNNDTKHDKGTDYSLEKVLQTGIVRKREGQDEAIAIDRWTQDEVNNNLPWTDTSFIWPEHPDNQPAIFAFDKNSTKKKAYVKIWAADPSMWNFILHCPVVGTAGVGDFKNANAGPGMKYPLMENGRPYIPSSGGDGGGDGRGEGGGEPRDKQL